MEIPTQSFLFDIHIQDQYWCVIKYEVLHLVAFIFSMKSLFLQNSSLFMNRLTPAALLTSPTTLKSAEPPPSQCAPWKGL